MLEVEFFNNIIVPIFGLCQTKPMDSILWDYARTRWTPHCDYAPT